MLVSIVGKGRLQHRSNVRNSSNICGSISSSNCSNGINKAMTVVAVMAAATTTAVTAVMTAKTAPAKKIKMGIPDVSPDFCSYS